jgi:hypothetical protein
LRGRGDKRLRRYGAARGGLGSLGGRRLLARLGSLGGRRLLARLGSGCGCRRYFKVGFRIAGHSFQGLAELISIRAHGDSISRRA